LVYPRDPSTGRLSAHSVLQSSNVSTEVNTVFQNLRDLLQKVDPPKLNAVLAAISHGDMEVDRARLTVVERVLALTGFIVSVALLLLAA